MYNFIVIYGPEALIIKPKHSKIGHLSTFHTTREMTGNGPFVGAASLERAEIRNQRETEKRMRRRRIAEEEEKQPIASLTHRSLPLLQRC